MIEGPRDYNTSQSIGPSFQPRVCCTYEVNDRGSALYDAPLCAKRTCNDIPCPHLTALVVVGVAISSKDSERIAPLRSQGAKLSRGGSIPLKATA